MLPTQEILVLVQPKDDAVLLRAILGSAAYSKIYVFLEKQPQIVRLQRRFFPYKKLVFRPLASLPAVLKDLEKTGSKIRQINGDFEAKKTENGILFVTAANGAFRWWFEQLATSLAKLDYALELYDLGNLRIGQPFSLSTPLTEEGIYRVVDGKWRSKALHKPGIMIDCFSRFDLPLVYVDADITVLKRIDEVFQEDFDIAVTVRSDEEIKEEKSKSTFAFTGYINAGVLFVKHTPKAGEFLSRWEKLTLECGNDQMALNRLVNPDYSVLKAGDSFERDGLKIRAFSGDIYNFNYDDQSVLTGRESVVHFKRTWDRLVHFQDQLPEEENASEDALNEALSSMQDDAQMYFIKDHLERLSRERNMLKNALRLERKSSFAVRARLKQIQQTWSWMITKPLRTVSSLLTYAFRLVFPRAPE